MYLFSDALKDLERAGHTLETHPLLIRYLEKTLAALGVKEIREEEKDPVDLPPVEKEQLVRWEIETKMLNERMAPADLREFPAGIYDVALNLAQPRGIGVQIASYTRPDQLPGIASGYQKQFGHPVFIEISQENDRRLYKIIVGNFAERDQAVALRSRLRDFGFLDSFLIRYP